MCRMHNFLRLEKRQIEAAENHVRAGPEYRRTDVTQSKMFYQKLLTNIILRLKSIILVLQNGIETYKCCITVKCKNIF